MRAESTWALGLLVAVVLAAALVNRFIPSQRVRIRRLAILYLVYVVALCLQLALQAAEVPVWAERIGVVAELLRAFTVVNLATTAAFSLLVPATGMTLPMIVSELVAGVGYILATLGVLAGHGLNPTGALASAAVVSAVLAISLQNTLGNILGGVALQLDGSVHEGDWLELADGRQGRVRAIRWRHTVVETRDFSTIIVPNSNLLANNITLLGKRGGERVSPRIKVEFNVDFRHSPNRVVDVINAALDGADIEGMASNPEPTCVCLELQRGESGSFATYQVRFWLLDLANLEPVSSRVRARIYTGLQRAEIPLAVPATQMRIEVDDEERANRKRTATRLGAMRGVGLFKTLTEPELEQLAGGLKPAIYTPGEVITRQGAKAQWLYILTKGTVQVRTNATRDTPAKIIATIAAPNVFGEMGLMTGEVRTADVIASNDVECYRLDRGTFQNVLSARPELAEALSTQLAQRRVELEARRDGDDSDTRARVDRERDRILDGIKSFFGL